MRHSLLALAAFALLAGAFPAAARVVDFAAVAKKTKNAELKKAARLSDKLEFEAALKALDKALASGKLDADETAAAALQAGTIAQSMGDAAKAQRYFERALEAVDGAELPAGASPKTRAAFAEAKSAVDGRKKPAVAAKPEPKPEPPAPVAPPPVPPPPPDLRAKPPAEVAVADTDTVAEEKPTPIYKKWWLWTGIGVLAVGAGVTAFALTRGSSAGSCTANPGTGCVNVTVPGLWEGR